MQASKWLLSMSSTKPRYPSLLDSACWKRVRGTPPDGAPLNPGIGWLNLRQDPPADDMQRAELVVIALTDYLDRPSEGELKR